MSASDPVAALVLAAGRGRRLGGDLPKAFIRLRGSTLVERSLRVLAAAPEVDHVTPVIARAELDRYARLGFELPIATGFARLAEPVAGGAERQDSVRAGLRSLSSDVTWVLVHDAARCLVGQDEIAAVVGAARETGAAILAVPSPDTIKQVEEGWIVETPDRSACWAAQTPQVFRRDLLDEAVEKAAAEGFQATDDAQLVERLGVRVRVALGRPSNLKITRPADLAVAEAWLAELEASSDAEASGP
jgi:2-C-methyl-D-erythritol 4-phosphate cytidylyltransferase